MKLILIRHTSVDVDKGVCYGQSDVPLASSFTEEAAEVRRKLMSYDIEKAYCSPLTRCRALARYCGYADAVMDARLMEMDFGAWEMKRYDEIDDPRLQEWFDDYINVRATGGESSVMQRDRFLKFIEDINDGSDSVVAIFTHGGILIHALVCFKGMTYDSAFTSHPGYGAIVEIDIAPSRQEPQP